MLELYYKWQFNDNFAIQNGRNNYKETRKALVVIDIQNNYFESGTSFLVDSLEASINVTANEIQKSFLAVQINFYSTMKNT